MCFYSVHIRGGKNFVIRYNALAVNVPGGYHEEDAQVLLYGNAGEGPACDDEGTTYAYNVWDDAKCSATDLRADPGFVKNNGDDFDLHVLPTSPVIGRGDPARFPAVDRDGRQRISPPDAGADERPWLQASVNGARVALTRGGKRLTRIPAGTYKVIVADRTKKKPLRPRAASQPQELGGRDRRHGVEADAPAGDLHGSARTGRASSRACSPSRRRRPRPHEVKAPCAEPPDLDLHMGHP